MSRVWAAVTAHFSQQMLFSEVRRIGRFLRRLAARRGLVGKIAAALEVPPLDPVRGAVAAVLAVLLAVTFVLTSQDWLDLLLTLALLAVALEVAGEMVVELRGKPVNLAEDDMRQGVWPHVSPVFQRQVTRDVLKECAAQPWRQRPTRLDEEFVDTFLRIEGHRAARLIMRRTELAVELLEHEVRFRVGIPLTLGSTADAAMTTAARRGADLAERFLAGELPTTGHTVVAGHRLAWLDTGDVYGWVRGYDATSSLFRE